MDNLSKGDKIYYPEMDIARGIAILLVVFAHCIQCGNGAESVSYTHLTLPTTR